MSPVRFESSMAGRMAGLVDFKRIQGYDYSAQAEMLRYSDRFLCREAWPEPRPTAASALSAARIPTRSSSRPLKPAK